MVPLNGALGRLFCKFSLLFSIVLLFVWIISQRKNANNQVENLEARLQLAQEQMSSLHAQIDVIVRHKEKLEQLHVKEKKHFQRLDKEKIQRIAYLEADNLRLNRTLTKLNQTIMAIQQNDEHSKQHDFIHDAIDSAIQKLPTKEPTIPNQAANGTKLLSENEEKLLKNDQWLDGNKNESGGKTFGLLQAAMPLPQQLIQPPPVAKNDEASEIQEFPEEQQQQAIDRFEQLEQHDGDPFDDVGEGQHKSGDGKHQGNNDDNRNGDQRGREGGEEHEEGRGVKMSTAHNGLQQPQERKNRRGIEPNGGEKTLAEQEEEEAGPMANDGDAGGGADYVFRRANPREDLVFDRGENVAADGDFMAKSKLMPERELMRKLAERRRTKQKLLENGGDAKERNDANVEAGEEGSRQEFQPKLA